MAPAQAPADRASANNLAAGQATLRATIEAAADALLALDADNRVLLYNRHFVELFAVPAELIDSHSSNDLVTYVVQRAMEPTALRLELQGKGTVRSRDDHTRIDLRDGRTIELRIGEIPSESGIPIGRVVSFRDATKSSADEQQLRRLAEEDALTGLLNRRAFDDELKESVERSARLGTPTSLLILDLDGVKGVNDSLGHAAGDALIASLADAVRERIRDNDVLGRLGGDEFGVLLPGTDLREAAELGELLLRVIRGHRTVADGVPVRATATAGVAAVPAGGMYDADDLISRADAAMYQAKESGRDQVAVDRSMTGTGPYVDRHRTWGDRIREALETDRFTLYAQPIVDLAEGSVKAYEVLLRLLGPNDEVLSPSAFLPAAERSGLVAEIDAWVMQRAIRVLADRQLAGSDVHIGVNLSGRTIGDPNLLNVIKEQLEATGADPQGLVVEITETAAIASMDAAREYADHLVSLGVRLAIDDFGAGFGSFYYAKHLPLDYLKIDGDFIEYLGRNPTDQAVVRAIVGLSDALRKNTIAEYVTDARTVEVLRGYGVDYAQGFHIGVPRPIDRVFKEAPVPQQFRRLRI